MAIALHKCSVEPGHFESVSVRSCVTSHVLEQFQEPAFELLTLDGEANTYSEAAFLYLLSIERERSERCNRPFVLLLAGFGTWPGAEPRISPEVAASVFSGLSQCLRDTDFIGWYRHEQVVGAVLTEGELFQDEKVLSAVRERVTRAVSSRLSTDMASRLQVRVYWRGPVRRRAS